MKYSTVKNETADTIVSKLNPYPLEDPKNPCGSCDGACDSGDESSQ